MVESPGSLRVRLTAATLVLAVAAFAACKGHDPPDDAGGAPATTSAAPPPQPRARFRPRHPDHVDQTDSNGGFVPARRPPAPAGVPVGRPEVEIVAPPPSDDLALPAKVNGACGSVTVAGSTFMLDCMDDAYGKVDGASTPLIERDEMLMGAARVLPSEVDHRQDHTEGPVMSQGGTLACTSFSLATAVDHALARYYGRPGDVSPMHAWARYHRPDMATADRVNLGHGLAAAAVLPFDEKLAKRWQDGTATPDPQLLRRADNEAVVDVAHVTALSHFPADLKSTLAAGQDVWLTLKAAHHLAKLGGKPGALVVPDYDYRKVAKSDKLGHALVVAGYRDTKDGTYYLLHNSWGDKWGDGGYAFIHEKTLLKNLGVAYVVEAHPHTNVPVLHPPATHPPIHCDGDLAPDSITGQCVPRCIDGSPRHNGVCAVASHCPPGRVNLAGECILAAPRYKGTVRGINIACAPAGCTYAVPKGTADCAEPGGCHFSCAAPRYRLGHGPRGVICTE
jgi:hypothetical protein